MPDVEWTPEQRTALWLIRDRLWCAALSVLDSRDIARVLEKFNDARPD